MTHRFCVGHNNSRNAIRHRPISRHTSISISFPVGAGDAGAAPSRPSRKRRAVCGPRLRRCQGGGERRGMGVAACERHGLRSARTAAAVTHRYSLGPEVGMTSTKDWYRMSWADAALKTKRRNYSVLKTRSSNSVYPGVSGCRFGIQLLLCVSFSRTQDTRV